MVVLMLRMMVFGAFDSRRDCVRRLMMHLLFRLFVLLQFPSAQWCAGHRGGRPTGRSSGGRSFTIPVRNGRQSRGYQRPEISSRVTAAARDGQRGDGFAGRRFILPHHGGKRIGFDHASIFCGRGCVRSPPSCSWIAHPTVWHFPRLAKSTNRDEVPSMKMAVVRIIDIWEGWRLNVRMMVACIEEGRIDHVIKLNTRANCRGSLCLHHG